MKNKLLFLLPFLLLTSCGGGAGNYEQFKKENAVTEYNSDNYTINVAEKSGTMDSYYDYFEVSGTYTSKLSGKTLYPLGDLASFTLQGIRVYYDTHTYQWYDGFGEDLPIETNPNYIYDIEYYYLFAAEDSPLYKSVSSTNSDKKALHPLTVAYVENYYVVLELGDTHFSAKNVFRDYDFDCRYELINIEDIDSVTQLNESEYMVSISGQKYRYYYDYNDSYTFVSEFETNVEHAYYSDSQSGKYREIMRIQFAGSNTSYYYSIKEVTGITNDFNFIMNGIRYKTNTNMGNGIVDFVPLSYIMSRNKDYCYVLCYKVDLEGNISNKYYAFRLDNTGSKGALSQDISVFSSNGYVKFNGRYYQLDSSMSLCVVSEKIMIYKSNSQYYYVTNSGEGYLDGQLVNNYSIHNKYYAVKTEDYGAIQLTSYEVGNRGDLYYSSYTFTDSISERFGIYRDLSSIHILPANITISYFSSYRTNYQTCTMFGKTTESCALSIYKNSSSSNYTYFITLSK